MKTVREITDHVLWDRFVSESPQGTIFSTTAWMELYDVPFRMHGYYKGDNLIGGIAGFDTPQPLTPFQGILVQNLKDAKPPAVISIHNEVAQALIDVVPREFYNHYTYPDIRPFKWAKWECDVRYTYIVNLRDLTKVWAELEKQTRYDINKLMKDPPIIAYGKDTDDFDDLYEQTFKRKGLDRPVSKEFIKSLFTNMRAELLLCYQDQKLCSSAMIIKDNKRAYYILGASDRGSTSSYTLWRVFQGLASRSIGEIDLVGANDYNIALFKRGLGGKLTPYYGVGKC